MKPDKLWKKSLRTKHPYASKIRERFEEEKAEQTRKSWHEKTASLTLKLWHLTKQLNDDNRQRKKNVLLVDGEPANVFAKAYKAVSSVNLLQERVRDVRQETK